MSECHRTCKHLKLTREEKTVLIGILNGELDNEGDDQDDYFNTIRSILVKLSKVQTL